MIETVPRPLGAEPRAWSAVTLAALHPGPDPDAPGAKRTDARHLDAARALAGTAGADEAILLDAAGRVVEGARTSLFVVTAENALLVPPAARGGVDGVALSVLRESGVAPQERDLDVAALVAAREIVAVNAVRGAISIVRLDGVPVGDGRPGPAQRRLAALLDAAG